MGISAYALVVVLSTAGPGLGLNEEADEAWASAWGRLQDNDFSTAGAHLDRLDAFRLKLQIPNLFDVSNTLLVEARRLQSEGLNDAARLLIEQAGRLAPDNPRVPLARAEWADALGIGFSDRLGLTLDGFRAARQVFPDRIRLIGRAAAIAQTALLWAVVLFGVAMLLRHGSQLRHDVDHLLPDSARGLPMLVLFVVGLIVAPLSVGLGLVPLALGWFVVMSAYMSWFERAAALLLSVGVLMVPTLNARYDAALQVGGSDEEALYQCYYGRCADDALARVHAAANRRDFDPLAKGMLGLRAKRLGAAQNDAIQALHDAVLHLSVASEADPKSYVLTVNLANASYNRAQRRCARNPADPPELELREREYASARKLAPDAFEAAVNATLVMSQKGERTDATAARSRALTGAPERVRRLVEAMGEPPADACVPMFNANLLLVDALPRLETLSESLLSRATSGPVLAPFGTLLAGIIPAARFPVLGGLAIVGILALAFAGSTLRPAYRCSQCHRVACERCRRELKANHICERCLFLQVKGGFVDPKEKWLRDRQTQQAAGRRRVWARLVSFVIPGSGLMATGRPLGLLYLLLFLVGGLAALVPLGLVPDPALAGSVAPIFELPGVVLALLGYLASLAHIHAVD